MPKVTQNRVYNTDGTTVQLDGTAESYVGFLSKFNALRYVQATVKVKAEDGTVTEKLVYNDDGSPKMIARPRNGYTQYWNNDGLTNPISPESSLNPQGIGKIAAKLFEVAHMIIRSGGKDADEMKTVIAGLFAYHAIADTEVAKASETNAMEEALNVLKKTTKGDTAAAQAKLNAYLVSKGITAPAPTFIEQPSVTVAETVESAVDAVESPSDAAPTETQAEIAADVASESTEESAEGTELTSNEVAALDATHVAEAVEATVEVAAENAENAENAEIAEPVAVDTALTVEQ